MNNKLLFLSISALLLTGCSSPEPERELKYDEAELIRYENCLATVRMVYTGDGLRRVIVENKWKTYLEISEKLCSDSKPVKK